MADELKDQRVVTMMSPSELEAIDDWMFKNRIRSRGEAIRRLCRIGMKAEEISPAVSKAIADVDDAIFAIAKLVGEARNDQKALQGEEAFDRIGQLIASAVELLKLNSNLTDEIVAMHGPGSFADAVKELERQRSEIDEWMARWKGSLFNEE